MKVFSRSVNGEKLKRRIMVIIGGVLAIVFASLLFLPNTVGTVKPDKRIGKLDGWYYEKDGKKKMLELPNVIEHVEDDTFVIENTVPEIPYRNSAIVFYSQQQKVRVFLEEEEIYTYPEKELNGGILPSNWNFIRLPEKSEGKHIRIEISSPYRQFQGKQDVIYCGSYNSLYYGIREENFPMFFMSLVIGIIGMVMFVISICLRKYRGYRCEETLGIVFILVSLWLCGVSQMVYEEIGGETRYYFTMLSALFSNVFFLSYMEQRVGGKCRRFTRGIFYLSLVSVAGCLLLHFTGVRDLTETSIYALGVLILSFIYSIIIYGKKVLDKEERYNKGELFCMILILMAGMIEWGHFYSKKWHTFGMCIRGAVLIYTVYLFGYYIWEIYSTVQLNKKLSKKLQNSEV